jgi:hypothetical protein
MFIDSRSRDSSVDTATRLQDGRAGFESRKGLGIFLITASRLALGPTQITIEWVPGVKRPGRADHSPHLAPRVGMYGAIPPLPNTSSGSGA